jgi:hypothetical protein
MSHIETYQVPDFAKVSTIHILKTGEIITSLEDYLKVQDKFTWVDQSNIIAAIFRLRRLTEPDRRSLIVVYEDGKKIKEYVNVDETFKPLVFY